MIGFVDLNVPGQLDISCSNNALTLESDVSGFLRCYHVVLNR